MEFLEHPVHRDLLDHLEALGPLVCLEWKDCLDQKETKETLACQDPLGLLEGPDNLDILDQKENRDSLDFPAKAFQACLEKMDALVLMEPPAERENKAFLV